MVQVRFELDAVDELDDGALELFGGVVVVAVDVVV